MAREYEQGTNTTELTPLNRIRVETALSRFPIHRLAKKGSVSIDLQRVNEAGEADFKWEVTYNVKHGQPGPLAYKIDTLIINRRIDDAPRPVPEAVKLGSLTEICSQLSIVDSGENRAHVRKALHQNASAYITARIRYRQKNGRERWGEIGYTRYSVVFTGETLPDGQTADAVYIVLNGSYRDLLNHVEVRPLDYDYLVQLAPGPQRLYELLSFPIYGCLINRRPRARLVYSDYCSYAPQTRYFDFDQVKKQMYKIHVPHRESGYIAKIEYQPRTDRDGNPDWDILYTPGPKAFSEYQSFANRTTAQSSTSKTISRTFRSPEQQSLPLEQGTHDHFVRELTQRGVNEKKARELVLNLKPGQELLDQIEYTDFVLSTSEPRKFRNPPGLYVRNIEDNIFLPPTFESSRQRKIRQELEASQHADRARTDHLRFAYEEHQCDLVDRFASQLPTSEYEQMLNDARRQLRTTYPDMTVEQLTDVAMAFIRNNLRNSGRVAMPTFEEFAASSDKTHA